MVPGLQVLDAEQSESFEMGHTASAYYSGKNKALAIDTGLPFGMTPPAHIVENLHCLFVASGNGISTCRSGQKAA
jgi:TRAP-type mannitol/chloroaromatic compound transport system substrate-binding protein